MKLFRITVFHRVNGNVLSKYFPRFDDAIRYAQTLYRFEAILEKATLTSMVIDYKDGAFRDDKVLKEYNFEENHAKTLAIADDMSSRTSNPFRKVPMKID